MSIRMTQFVVAVSLLTSAPALFADDPVEIDRYGDSLPLGVAQRLGTARLRNGSGALAVAFSPDGKRLTTSGWDATIRVWDLRTGMLVQQLRGSLRAEAFGLAFSPDGAKIAASCGQGLVYLFDVKTGAELLGNKLELGNRTFGVAFAPDGKTYAAACNDGVVRVLDSATGNVVDNVHVPGPGVRDQFAVAYSPDGGLLAAGYSKGIVIVDAKKWTTLITIPQAHGGQTVSLAFTPDGKELVSGGCQDPGVYAEAEIKVWNSADGALIRTLSPGLPKRAWCALALSHDGKTLVSSHKEDILVWDFDRGRVIRTIDYGEKAYAGYMNQGIRTHGVALSPDGSAVASISRDNRVRVWKVDDGTPLLDYPDSHGGSVHCVAWLPDGKQLVSASDDRTVRRWDADTGQQLGIVYQGTSALHQALVSRNGRTLIITGEDRDAGTAVRRGVVRFTDLASNQQLGEDFPDSVVTAAALSADGKNVAIASGRGASSMDPFADIRPVVISILDVDTRIKIAELTGHTSQVVALRFSPDGKALLSAAHDGTIRRWDLEKKRLIRARILKELGRNRETDEDTMKPTRLTAAGLSPDMDTVIVAAGRQEYLSIQSLQAVGGKRQIDFPGFEWGQSNIAVSPDGTMAAVAGGQPQRYDNRIVLIDLTAGRQIHEFEVEDWPDTLEFSPDGKRLACGTRIGTIVIYNLPESVLRQLRSAD